MALKIELKPFEKISLGPVASVIANSDQRTTLYILADIPRISGLLDMIFGLIEARRNEIRSQLSRWQPK